MTGRMVGLGAVLLLIMSGIVAAESDDTPTRQALVIRTYNTYRVPSEHLRTAQDTAVAILNDAGIDIQWLDCSQANLEPIGDAARCGQAPGSNELLLRIQANGPVGSARIKPMGFSMVSRHPEDYAPFFATVFADVVAVVARGAGVDARRLLGYAVAHEIGHLLLNTSRHAESGLMRASWSRSELQAARPADWAFQMEEADTIRRAIATRLEVRPEKCRAGCGGVTTDAARTNETR